MNSCRCTTGSLVADVVTATWLAKLVGEFLVALAFRRASLLHWHRTAQIELVVSELF